MADSSDIIVVGIDFGATRSYISYWTGTEVAPIECEPEDGNHYLPTYVNYSNPRQIKVGTPAKKNLGSPDTIYFVKQLLGCKFKQESDISSLPSGHCRPILINQEPHYRLSSGKTVTPMEVYIEILKKLKEIVHKRFPLKEFIKAAITLPAKADDEFRKIIRDGALSLFDDVALLSEPSAAAVAYSLEAGNDGNNIAVVDIGAASTEIAIATFRHSKLEILSKESEGVGGIHFDHATVDHVLKALNREDSDDTFRSLVRLACFKAKTELDEKESTTITVEGYNPITLTRREFNSWNAEKFNNIIKSINRTMREASLDPSKIHHVLLIGGSSRIPQIIESIDKIFKNKIVDHSNMEFDPDEATAQGATREGVRVFEESEDAPVLSEIASRNIGMQTYGGVMTSFITFDTPIPTSRPITKPVTTSRDNQTSLSIKVYEGEDKLTRNNKLLGTFNLTKIPPKPKGVAKVQVSFEMDRDGILVVKASEGTHGYQNHIRISRA